MPFFKAAFDHCSAALKLTEQPTSPDRRKIPISPYKGEPSLPLILPARKLEMASKPPH